MLWFLRTSWSYLGCDHGTGRWRARWQYATGIWGAARRYRKAVAADRAQGWAG